MAENLYKEIAESGDYIFLSYKKENIDRLREIVPHFQFNTWYDFGIHYTETWSESIVNHIKNCSAVILFLSKELLKPGTGSFPFYEYNIAIKNNKKVLVVYLEEIDYQDVPDSMAVWYEEINARQCLVYRKDRTEEALIEEIHHAIADITGISLPAVPKSDTPAERITMYCCSNSQDNSILYLGTHDLHLSQDLRKICLYNVPRNTFEVRLMENLNCVLARFPKNNDAISASRLFYTPNNEFLFYFAGDRIFTYDLTREKWLNKHGTAISLEKEEHLVSVISPDAGNQVYLLAQKKGFLSNLILLNIAENKAAQSWSLAKFKLKNTLQHLHSNELNAVLFYDENDRLAALDLTKLSFVNLTVEQIQTYYQQEEHLYEDVSQELSHDGQMYAVQSLKSLRIFSTVSHHLIEEAYFGSYQDLYLLKDRVVLKYDSCGSVYQITANGKKCLFQEENFRNDPHFHGNIPHTMFYDEENRNFIFVVSCDEANPGVQKIVVIDSHKRVIRHSDPMVIPFSDFVCKCSIHRGELMVLFTSKSEISKNRQNTYIFKGTYC